MGTAQFFRGNLVVFLGLLTLILFYFKKSDLLNKSFFDLLAYFCEKILDQKKNLQKNPNWGGLQERLQR